METITPENNLTLKEKILFSLGGLVLATSIVIVSKKMIEHGISNNEENKTFDEDNTATYAKAIKMAFENDGYWGTNTAALRDVLRRVPTKKMFASVVKSYRKLYNANLFKDMSDELQSTEYNEMLYIIASKPDSMTEKTNPSELYKDWAIRLKAAFDKSYGFMPGTDEDAIKAVFTEIQTQAEFQQVAVAYQKEYSRNLIDDLKGELEFWEYSSYMNIIYSKPKM